MTSGVSQGSVSGHLFFNIFICGLFFDDIDVALANYAVDPSPYAFDLENEKLIKVLHIGLDPLGEDHHSVSNISGVVYDQLPSALSNPSLQNLYLKKKRSEEIYISKH